jgi:hypothetical protein
MSLFSAKDWAKLSIAEYYLKTTSVAGVFMGGALALGGIAKHLVFGQPDYILVFVGAAILFFSYLIFNGVKV